MTSLYNWAIISAISLGSFNYGFAFGAPSTALGIGGFLQYFGVDPSLDDPAYSNSMQGAIVGVFFAGGFVSSFFSAWLADTLGRKRALDILNVISIVAVILQASAMNVVMLLVGRILAGIGTGGLNVVCPIFQSEIATKDERGKNVGAHGFMFVFGLSCVNWVALGCFFITNEEMAWRLVFGLQGVPPALLLLIGIWLPESPRWLVMKGRTNEAYDIMTKLHETSRTLDSHDIFHAEIATIEQQIEIESHYDLSWIGLFKRPSTRRRLLLGMFMMFFQQSTGQNVLYGFQVNILSQLGLTDWQPLLVVAFYTLWAAVLNIAGAAVVDKVGRRPMFLIGLTGVVLSLAIHVPLVIIYSNKANPVGAGAAVAFLFVFITFFAPFIDVTSYIYAAEIYPNYMRARGVAVSISTYFGFAALYVCLSSYAATTIGPYFNIIFLVISAVNLLITYRYVPETTKISLEEMGRIFGEDREAEVEPVAYEGNDGKAGGDLK